ncbi:MAG: glycosyltransferase [Anaerolineae bacterium]|nr:glycosyltransferase [Anaerolineae bacterium]
MRALSELFDETVLVVPCIGPSDRRGEIPLVGHNLSIAQLTMPWGTGIWRKIGFPLWLLRSSTSMVHEILRADAVHTPVPGDIGTIGIFLAVVFRKRLFVRHCGNWLVQRTYMERILKWIMERLAGGRNVMLATGGAPDPPSPRNPHIHWIFSTTLSHEELSSCGYPRSPKPSGEIRLIMVGRQEWNKGTSILIESLPILFNRFPKTVLDVVGDGTALPTFRKLAGDLGILDKVVFHGRVTHDTVMQLLRRADIFCFPTAASEGFPKAVLEALACGLPVITTNVSVLPQLVGQGCGLLLDDRTSEAIARAVCLISEDPTRYHDMSACALATAKSYSLERWRDVIGDHLHTAWGPLKSHA